MLEMELEKLEDLLKLLEGTDSMMLVGQINYIGEAQVSIDTIVTCKAEYNGEPVIISYKEEVGRESLPADDKDIVALQKVDELEKKVVDKKMFLKKMIEDKKFTVTFGVWKNL